MAAIDKLRTDARETTEHHPDSFFAAMQNTFRDFVGKLRLPVKQHNTGDPFLPPRCQWGSTIVDVIATADEDDTLRQQNMQRQREAAQRREATSLAIEKYSKNIP